MPSRLVAALILAAPCFSQSLPTPEWIWASASPKDDGRVWLSRTIDVPDDLLGVKLVFAADNHFIAWWNGRRLGQGDSWQQPNQFRLGYKPGKNVLAIEAWNDGGPAACAGRIVGTRADGSHWTVTTDGAWQATTTKPTGSWQKAGVQGKAHSFGSAKGNGTWGNPFGGKTAPDPATFSVHEGFAVDLVHSAQPGEGSWVSMVFDPKGGLILSPQTGPLRRFIPGDNPTTVAIDTPVHSSHGLRFVGNELFAQVSTGVKAGGGFHRLTDADGDGTFEEHKLLRPYYAGSEHGGHAIQPGKDGALWLIQGNYTDITEVAPDSPFANYQEDVLLPRLFDPRGHARHVRMPAGRVLRTDRDASHWTIYCGGMRNPYDFVFGPDNEMFTFDADMEWDLGSPWYRPTRIIHLVSGGDYGWRTGAAKWPAEYPDSLPGAIDIGPGSPTGIVYGGNGNYSAPWDKRLLVGDWTFGRILAIDLQPTGSTYKGTQIELLKGRGLTITDLQFGPKGDLWFVTGGRRTQSGLYRVRQVERATPVARVDEASDSGARARKLRRSLEALHGKTDATGIDTAWPHLSSSDRFIAFAARVAIEHREPELWRERALTETNTTARLTALLALARTDAPEKRAALLRTLSGEDWSSLDKDQQLLWLRALMVHGARHGKPASVLIAGARDTLTAQFPTGDPQLDSPMLELLVFLDTRNVLEQGLDLLETSDDFTYRMQIAYHLRHVRRGWNAAQVDRFLLWVRQAAHRKGGESLKGYVKAIANTLREVWDPASEALLDEALAGKTPPVRTDALRTWTIADLQKHLDGAGKGRSFERGRSAYSTAQCASCHRFGSVGGRLGPDLTAIGQRFSRAEILEAILNPSKAISDQYENTELRLKDGSEVVGRVLAEENGKINVELDPFTGVQQQINASDVVRRRASPVSPMPDNLLGYLELEQILDLLAFIESGGNEKAPAFGR